MERFHSVDRLGIATTVLGTLVGYLAINAIFVGLLPTIRGNDSSPWIAWLYLGPIVFYASLLLVPLGVLVGLGFAKQPRSWVTAAIVLLLSLIPANQYRLGSDGFDGWTFIVLIALSAGARWAVMSTHLMVRMGTALIAIGAMSVPFVDSFTTTNDDKKRYYDQNLSYATVPVYAPTEVPSGYELEFARASAKSSHGPGPRVTLVYKGPNDAKFTVSSELDVDAIEMNTPCRKASPYSTRPDELVRGTRLTVACEPTNVAGTPVYWVEKSRAVSTESERAVLLKDESLIDIGGFESGLPTEMIVRSLKLIDQAEVERLIKAEPYPY